MNELPPTTGLLPAAVASTWMFAAHILARNTGPLSRWRFYAGLSTAVWHVSTAWYSFAFIGYFIRVADQPLPVWVLQIVMVTSVLFATWIVVRYLFFYVGKGMAWREAALRAFGTDQEDEE